VPRRLVAPGVPLGALPKLDVVLVSHGHMDHLDVPPPGDTAHEPRFRDYGERHDVDVAPLPIGASVLRHGESRRFAG
jgi:L-ascorbate metabolism protein UlaG (beta-lactamase superfamily)